MYGCILFQDLRSRSLTRTTVLQSSCKNFGIILRNLKFRNHRTQNQRSRRACSFRHSSKEIYAHDISLCSVLISGTHKTFQALWLQMLCNESASKRTLKTSLFHIQRLFFLVGWVSKEIWTEEEFENNWRKDSILILSLVKSWLTEEMFTEFFEHREQVEQRLSFWACHSDHQVAPLAITTCKHLRSCSPSQGASEVSETTEPPKFFPITFDISIRIFQERFSGRRTLYFWWLNTRK